MRIKQLELVGFKSFVERSVLTFSDGVSAIVGPNGCGKSNVVDAIRWSLGEQSPKHLRGAAMEDVIFKGNDRRAPLGMAEVSLTFENDPQERDLFGDPDLDASTIPAHVRGLAEITVTRRYYRSGESEYFINRAPCRLKDITELFLGTGVGSKAYAIIEQGRVEQLINAKPEERRWFIEEAAGTTLYRSRKVAAERKMERTRENLLRVTDILREVERQIQYLNRQAKKAEQYRTLKGELRELEIAIAADQWRSLRRDVESLEEALAALALAEESLAAELKREEIARGESQGRVEASAGGLGQLRETAARDRADLEARKQRGQWLHQELSEREERLLRLSGEIAALTAQEAELATAAEELERERAVVAEKLASEESLLQSRSDAMDRQRELLRAAEQAAESLKDQLVGVLGRQADVRNQLGALQRREEDATRRIERLRAEEEQARRQLADVDGEVERQRIAVVDLRDRLRQLEGEREARSRRVRQLEEERRGTEAGAAEAQSALLHLRSRLQSLVEIQSNYEGYHRGVRSIMLSEERAEGVLGVVADVIAAPREYEKAVAAVLGDRLQYMIVSGEDQAIGAVQMLRSEESGRASFIPRMPRRISLNPERKPASNGVSARLMDLIRVEEPYRDVAEMLLGDVVVVPDLRTALSLWRRNGIHVTMVTPEGDVLDAHGVITGGSERGTEEEILARKREIEELGAAIAAAAESLERRHAQLSLLKEAQATEESALRELDAGVHALTLKAMGLDKDKERLDAERQRCLERIEVIRFESQAGLAEAAEMVGEGGALRAELSQLDGRRQELDLELQERQSNLLNIRDESASLQEELTASRVRFAELRERHSALTGRAGELARRHDEASQRAERLLQEQAETTVRCEAVRAEMEQVSAVVADGEARLAEMEDEITRLAQALEALRQGVARQDAAIERGRRAIDDSRSDRLAKETALAERRMRGEHLEQTIREKHEADLPAAAEATKGEALDEAAGSRLEQVRERLLRIGEVNVGAIEELKELEDRGQFLRTQKEDLERSLTDLEHTIAKLNRASRARFLETFKQVDEKFRSVFPRLFRGGEAHLVLTDEHNLLESGVEIFVRPPGKKLDTVTLLSGGEKALVAVSLIFSLFLISPTPFCFLDEVDAPLDDANVGRFVQMVREMREHTQFIMITHNKRTMEAADCLYGVTMEEPGVSKLISVAMR